MKIIGIGLNKTGTKTLAHYLRRLGFNNHTFDLDAFKQYQRGDIAGLLKKMEQFDSFEDWPWPLFYKEIDAHFPDARFILTTRATPDIWYRSLCNMAVRIGPLDEYEQHIYGYAMPQGHRDEHVQFYNRHNAEVEAHFNDRPTKLLKLCWDNGDSVDKLINFLGVEDAPDLPPRHINRSSRWIYRGDKLWIAEMNRAFYQSRPAKRWRKTETALRAWNAKYRAARRARRSQS